MGISPGRQSSRSSLLRYLPLNDRYQHAQDFAHGRNYSNEGFPLAAAILEKTTGIPWAEIVRQRIFHPLDMNRTFAVLAEDEERRISGQIAGAYSVSVERPLGALGEKRNSLGNWGFKYTDVHQYVRKEFSGIRSLPVQSSQASRASPNLGTSPLGAAARNMSTVSDLLKFYRNSSRSTTFLNTGNRASDISTFRSWSVACF